MADILIKNAKVLTMDKNRRYIGKGAIATEGSRIIAVGDTDQIERKYRAEKVIDAKKMVAMPGLINGHDHYEQSFLKGLTRVFTGTTLEWLTDFKIPFTKEMRAKDYYFSSMLACVEMIKMGVTCGVNSLCQQSPYKVRKFGADNAAKAVADSGMRSIMAISVADKFEPSELLMSIEDGFNLVEDIIRKWHKGADDRIRVWPGPVSVSAVSTELWLALMEVAEKYNLGIHTHLASSSRGDVKEAYETGRLASNVTGAHCVWLDEKDINILAKTGVKAVHNPTYKLSYAVDCPVEKFGDGIAPVAEMMKAGVTVGIGNDGCLGDTHDLFKEMRCLAFVQHYRMLDKTLMPPTKLLEMATIDCAKTVRWEDEIGSLEPGKKADLILIDIDKVHMTPWTNTPACLVYLASGFDVDTVIINGKIVMENREIKTVRETDVMRRAQKAMEELIEKIDFGWALDKGFKPWCSDYRFDSTSPT